MEDDKKPVLPRCNRNKAGEYAKKARQRHGLHTMKQAIKTLGERGLSIVKKSSKLGRVLDQWTEGLIADLGGRENISQQQATIVEMAMRTKLMLDSIDAWMLQQPSLINTKRRQLYPVVLQRQQLADALARYLAQLGLERRAKSAPTLQDYINGGDDETP